MSVLKGQPPPDSPFTLDLLNSLVKEEEEKTRLEDGQSDTFEEFTRKWRYNQKRANPGEALVLTFQGYARDWNCNPARTALKLEEMVRAYRARRG